MRLSAAPFPNSLGITASRCWTWLASSLRKATARTQSRRLRLCESLSLGDKRFVAVVQFEEQRFLVGGGTTSVSLLAELGKTPDFHEVLIAQCERES